MKRVLNLGAGTQSSVLLLMANRGEIERVDVAVFADTGWEPGAVYEHLEWLESEVDIPIVRVSGGDIYEDSLISQVGGKDGRWASMPLYVKRPDSESQGMIRRQCTKEYKIEPIRRYIKEELLGLSKHARWPKEPVVTQVFGISADEYQRMRSPDGAWVVNEYPLVKMRWPRSRAINWAEDNYPGRVFPRSACVGCPFHSDREWSEVQSHPEEWNQAVHLDEEIRHADGMRGEVYLHQTMRPLSEIDFRSSDEKNGQLSLWQDECEGMCGV